MREHLAELTAEIARLRTTVADVVGSLERERSRRAQAEAEIDRLREENRKLAADVGLDGLTGLANRSAFDAAFATEWQRAMRAENPLSLLLVDLDHFKSVNDGYGHFAGDRVLVAVAEALRLAVSRAGELVARWGGDEFAVLVPWSSTSESSRLGEKIRGVVRALAIPAGGEKVVTTSIGVSTRVPAMGDDKSSLFEAADRALYRAKVTRDAVVHADGLVAVPT